MRIIQRKFEDGVVPEEVTWETMFFLLKGRDVMGTRSGSLGALFVLADWQLRVFWSFGLIDRPSDRLYVRTIPLSGCMDRHYRYTTSNSM